MFCRGILVIGPKRAVEDCGARYENYRCSGRPDGTEAEFQLCPSNGIVSSRAYLRHSSKQQEREERIEREEIIPKEIGSLLYHL